ncbi:MAG: YggT family protein [Gammaproteobacteria bacterium]
MNLSNLLIFLIFNLLSSAFLVLMILRAFRANYFNPVVKFFVTYFEKPKQKFIPFLPSLVSSLFLALLLKCLANVFIYDIQNYYKVVVFSLVGLVNLFFRIIFYIVVASVIFSWVARGSRHALIELVNEISDKALAPIRSIIPSFGGLDFTPIFFILILNYANSLMIDIVRMLAQSL